MQAGLRHLRANEAAVLAMTDPEGIHQMRVALRSLRAIVSAFAPILASQAHETLRTELKWIQTALAPARDWDVFIDETLRPAIAGMPDAHGLASLLDAAETARAAAHAKAKASILSPRYTALILHLQRWLVTDAWLVTEDALGKDRRKNVKMMAEVPAAPFAVSVLDRRLRKLTKLAGRHKALPRADLHMIRILAKKLRYSGEVFAGLFDRRRTRTYLQELSAIQNGLGSLNDGVTAGRLLDFLAKARQGDSPIEVAAATVRGWEASRIKAEVERFSGLWRAFARRKPFWR
jgi:CHAD domain-containing protein